MTAIKVGVDRQSHRVMILVPYLKSYYQVVLLMVLTIAHHNLTRVTEHSSVFTILSLLGNR